MKPGDILRSVFIAVIFLTAGNHSPAYGHQCSVAVESRKGDDFDHAIGMMDIILSDENMDDRIGLVLYRKDFFEKDKVRARSYYFDVIEKKETVNDFYLVVCESDERDIFSGYIDLRDMGSPVLELKNRDGRVIANISEDGLRFKAENMPDGLPGG